MTDISSFPKRQLGKSGITVAPIGLGCMSLSGAYGPSGDDDGIALIHAAIDSGVTLIDSSDMYGWGHNEELHRARHQGQARQDRAGDEVRQPRRQGRQIRRRPAGVRRRSRATPA